MGYLHGEKPTRFFFFLFFLRSFSTNQAQVESHFQQDGKLRMQDLLWWQRLQWKVWMHFLRLQVNKGNQTSASHWLPSHAVDDLPEEMRERGHSGKLESIVD